MRPLYKMNVIQIELTNACIRSCANCTRFCGHHKKPFYMDLPTFKKAVKSMQGFDGMVGIMGGEPTIHPDFEELIKYYDKHWHPDKHRTNGREPLRNMAEYVILNDLQNWTRKRGLWTSLGRKYYEHFETIQDVFDFQLINDHSHPGLHQSILVSRKELGVPDEEWYELRDACWVQNSWSASITPKGAFFCEIAASLDMLFDGPGGWPIEPGWWKRTPEEFGSQLDWCEMCGACLKVPRRVASTEMDVVSPLLLDKLEQVDSPKLERGKVEILDVGEYKSGGCDYNSEWYLPEGDNTLRVSTTNRTVFPKDVHTIVSDGFAKVGVLDKDFTDWLIISSHPVDSEFIEKFRKWIFNPGCLYVFDIGIAVNRLAHSLQGVDLYLHSVQDLLNLWDPEKIIEVGKLKDPGNVEESLYQLSIRQKEKTAEMTYLMLSVWQEAFLKYNRVALFGCGQHTEWLLQLICDNNLKKPALIIDDDPHHTEMSGVPVINARELQADMVQAIVVSSDVHAHKMFDSARQRWGDKFKIINPYDGIENPFFQK